MGTSAESLLPQIKSTVANILIILIGAPIAGIGLSWMNNELTGWSDVPKALDHGLFIGFCMSCAWLGMASPVSGRFRALISSIRTADGKQEMKVALSDEPPRPETTRTTTIDPKTQKVTIKEEPAPKERDTAPTGDK